MQSLIGIGLVLVYNTLVGISAVYLSSFLHRADFAVVLFSVFAVVSVFFNAVLAARRSRRRIERSSLKMLAMINLATAASWSAFFYAVEQIEPALASSFINAILPLATIGVDFVLLRRQQLRPREVAVACASFLAMMLTAVVAFGGHSGMVSTPFAYAVGLGTSAICGVSMSLTNVASKRLNNAGVSPEQIMAYRFIVLTLGAGVVAARGDLAGQVAQYWMPILVVAVIGNLVPVYALQLGIQRLQPVTVAFLIGLAPIIIFFLQGFSKDIAFSWASLAATAATTALVLAGTYVSMARPRRIAASAGMDRQVAGQSTR